MKKGKDNTVKREKKRLKKGKDNTVMREKIERADLWVSAM